MNIRGPVNYSSAGEHKRSHTTLEAISRDVCAGCNNGWMHDLEESVRPVLTLPLNGWGPLPLPEHVQRTLSLWAVKTYLLLERSIGYLRGEVAFEITHDPERNPFYAMYQRREPPPGFQVWMGAVSAVGSELISFISTQWVGDPPERPVGMTGIFTLGCVLFHIYTPVGFVGEPDKPGMGLGIRGGMAAHLLEIWPANQQIGTWPPSNIFPPDQLEVIWPSGGFIQARP
jgi:hypothetical protein